MKNILELIMEKIVTDDMNRILIYENGELIWHSRNAEKLKDYKLSNFSFETEYGENRVYAEPNLEGDFLSADNVTVLLLRTTFNSLGFSDYCYSSLTGVIDAITHSVDSINRMCVSGIPSDSPCMYAQLDAITKSCCKLRRIQDYLRQRSAIPKRDFFRIDLHFTQMMVKLRRTVPKKCIVEYEINNADMVYADSELLETVFLIAMRIIIEEYNFFVHDEELNINIILEGLENRKTEISFSIDGFDFPSAFTLESSTNKIDVSMFDIICSRLGVEVIAEEGMLRLRFDLRKFDESKAVPIEFNADEEDSYLVSRRFSLYNCMLSDLDPNRRFF